jgi:hypothetical protein
VSDPNLSHPSTPASLEWHPQYRAMAFFWLYARAVERAGEVLASGEPESAVGDTSTPNGERWVLVTSAGYGRDSAAIAAGWASGLVRCVRRRKS